VGSTAAADRPGLQALTQAYQNYLARRKVQSLPGLLEGRIRGNEPAGTVKGVEGGNVQLAQTGLGAGMFRAAAGAPAEFGQRYDLGGGKRANVYYTPERKRVVRMFNA
jgi:hypothetical protein